VSIHFREVFRFSVWLILPRMNQLTRTNKQQPTYIQQPLNTLLKIDHRILNFAQKLKTIEQKRPTNPNNPPRYAVMR